ncbi:S phase cyclin A-associated protein in the endoplasmic reticulum [Wyeomyia smithii]|uniref:S phase cyclin A-associated protein in the endoplasmic reticulum n=1 Tax=Wyeomyia smithii TaxID=174621 RepID=UPI002467E4C4|nr:S phase cyclin A-associated protein in the endoplasmic reticulum [Wyeomyia smithii]XP_055541838.1 S phase cyclin A-associated protein in the endoplasmic reticulum [Wyeomyia smithii]XP_055541839.1 S phase cyclin A-associated protein in the endoplasmic reticulum [Wyeomyia smithii]
MENRRYFKQEGKEAKNFYHLSDDGEERNYNVRKPPVNLRPRSIQSVTQSKASKSSAPRVRSASTGRDKKSELQARYWAFLFGNLQRSVNEIYQTVECYENLPSCQEAILVLENYIRDFRALAEWFKVSWDYEATPLPQRPHSLAWEVRKSNPAPRVRKPISSPGLSGKSSPSFSGKNSPNHASEEQSVSKTSPKKQFSSTESLGTSRKGTGIAKVCVLKQIGPCTIENGTLDGIGLNIGKTFTTGENSFDEVVVCNSLENYVLKLDQYTQTNLDDENLTLAEYLEKYCKNEECNILPGAEVKAQAEQVCKSGEDNLQENKKISEAGKNTEKVDPLVKKAVIPAAKYATVVNNAVKPTPRPILQNKQSLPSKIVSTKILKTPSTITNSIRLSATMSSLTQSQTKIVQLPTKSATISNIHSAGMRSGARPLVSSKNKTMPTNAASRLSARSKTMIEINNRKNEVKPATASSRLTFSRKMSRDDIDSSTSTLKASTDRLGSRSSINESMKNRTQGGAPSTSRRSEPKSLPSETSNNDGWYTVKTKRRSSLHWATRFNQPSGYASLPSLSLLDENTPAEESESKLSTESISTQPKMQQKSSKPTTVSKLALESKSKTSSVVNVKPKNPPCKPTTVSVPKRPTTAPAATKKSNLNGASQSTQNKPTIAATTNRMAVTRQKSDLTGLKLKTLHKEFLRNEKLKLKPSSETELDKTDEAITTSKSPPSQDASLQHEDLVSHLNKVDMNIQTNLVSSTIQNLYAKCLESSDIHDEQGYGGGIAVTDSGVKPDHQPDINLSSCDELEEREDIESDEDQRKLLEEQESLEAQIRELQNSEIDVDTETDETDCEAIIDLEDNDGTAENLEPISVNGLIDEDEMTLEMRYESVLAEMSWVERAQTLATLQALVARHPGRAQQLHAKLSSPSRRRSLHETLKKYQAKQTRALEKRQALQKEKALKIQHLLARVEDVKTAKQQLIEKKRMRMEERLQRAAENRTQYLKDKIKKAHDEEEKLKEIAFIKNLEAQNKRLDFIESCKEQEGRLQDLETERQKRAEEKAAKEAAVERRRQEIEQERQKKLQIMSENRREREKRVGKMQEQKEKQRQALAREKARDREERLLALQAQQQATTEELQRKIIQKQQESARRHEENIEHIRQRAVELTIPTRNADEVNSNKQDQENDDNLSVSDKSNKDNNNARINKKKLKKLRLRMAQEAETYIAEMQPLAPQIRKQSQVPKLLGTIVKGGGPLGVERPLGQLLRLMAKAEVVDFQSMWLLDGLKTIADLIQTGMEPNSEVSKRAVVISVQLYRNSCSLCPQISRHAILGNTITVLLDALQISLKTPEEKSPLYPVELSTELILACTVALSPSNSLKQTHPKVVERLPDLISYTVCLGLIDTLVRKFNTIRESVESQQSLVLSLLASLGLLTKLAELCPRGPDVTKFLLSVKSTELFGTISLLYAAIVPIGESIPPRTISLAAATFNLLVTLANLDIATFQGVLTEENLSFKFLDVVSILLQYCVPKAEEKGETQAVIIDLIATLGFFCANNKINQDRLTSDQSSVIIKSLTKLPKKFDMVIYPTLVTVTYENPEAKAVLGKDFDITSLEEYSRSDLAKKNRIVSLLTKTE